MKSISFFLTLILCSLSSVAQDDTSKMRLVAAGGQESLGNLYGLQDIMIYAVIAKRCRRYMTIENEYPCKEAVATMLEELDTDVLIPNDKSQLEAPGSFLFVAFKQDLISLLSDERTQDYLEFLNGQVNAYLTGALKKFNLWESSVSYYRSKKLAAKSIAVLFQDITPARLHLAYLEKAEIKIGAQFESNKVLLERSISNLNTLMDLQDKNYVKLFYPAKTQDPINRNFYHFYVPYYLYHQLLSRDISPEMSAAAPFMMTITYEFLTAAEDYRYVFSDPETLGSDNIWKLKDIFAGYQGAFFGLRAGQLSEFEEIAQMFSESTSQAVHYLLQN